MFDDFRKRRAARVQSPLAYVLPRHLSEATLNLVSNVRFLNIIGKGARVRQRMVEGNEERISLGLHSKLRR